VPSPLVSVTGMGTVNAIAASVAEFADALRAGVRAATAFSWQQEAWDARARKVLRNNTNSTRLSACVVAQALRMSGEAAPPDRTGLIVAGNNLHQQYIADNMRTLESEAGTINARYALCYADTNQVGSLTDIFGIRGMSYTVGGASASGNVALLHAWNWLRAGVLDACVVVGASTELSAAEQHGLSIIGAASTSGTCRPFDVDRDGFKWQPGAACMVLERADAARARGAEVFGEISGAAMVMDGNYSSDCTVDGESRAMHAAMAAAGVGTGEIDYVNAHGTGSALGDDTECAALRRVFGDRAAEVWVNSTKSMVGHCLTAAGVVEAVATLLQLNGGFVHPNPELRRPIDSTLRFAGQTAVAARCRTALSNGFGFGGFNTALVLKGAAAL
jgi:malonyl-ACP decarboxylase